MQGERGATLVPAINSGAWAEGVSTKLVLFRDWIWQGDQAVSARFVGVQKLDGKPAKDADDVVVAFDIDTVSPSALLGDAVYSRTSLSRADKSC